MYSTFIHLKSIQQDINSSVSVVVLKEQGIFSELTHRVVSRYRDTQLQVTENWRDL